MTAREEATSIRLSKKTKALLEKAKVHPRETHEDVIKRLLAGAKR